MVEEIMNFEENYMIYKSDITLNYQMEKRKSIQVQAGVVVTGAWKDTNWDKVNEEIGWYPLPLP